MGLLNREEYCRPGVTEKGKVLPYYGSFARREFALQGSGYVKGKVLPCYGSFDREGFAVQARGY